MLCPSCEEHRFPELYRNKAVSAAASAADVKTKTQPLANPNSESEKEVVHSDCKLVQCELLFFVMSSHSQHPEATIKSTILEFYREDEILQAKQVLIHSVEHVEGLNTQSFVKKRSGVNKLKSSGNPSQVRYWSLTSLNITQRLSSFMGMHCVSCTVRADGGCAGG